MISGIDLCKPYWVLWYYETNYKLWAWPNFGKHPCMLPMIVCVILEGCWFKP